MPLLQPVLALRVPRHLLVEPRQQSEEKQQRIEQTRLPMPDQRAQERRVLEEALVLC